MTNDGAGAGLRLTRRRFLEMLAVVGATGAAAGVMGCSNAAPQESTVTTLDLAINTAAWSYDKENDIYYQIGLPYCEKPAAPTYESMGVYVPGPYFDAKENGDGTYTCTPSETGAVNGFTAKTAPIVMPINTAGYSAQAAPTEYSARGLTEYLQAGFVYVFAGCRGRKMEDDASGAAPWGVADLKSAVRTLRYNAKVLPGNTDRIFSFGHSGGGAQSAVLGATGDAPEYDGYLATIGAPAVDADDAPLTDSIFGAMCWCPITNLDVADAAYEWNMGQFADTGTRAEGTFTRLLSRNLSTEFAEHVNGLGLVDASGAKLSLAQGGEGIYTKGSYYDYVKAQVEASLNNFLADTAFPYTPSEGFNADMGAGGGKPQGTDGPGGGPGAGGKPQGAAESGVAAAGNAAEGATGNAPAAGTAPQGDTPAAATDAAAAPAVDNAPAADNAAASSARTYETPADYIAALNGDAPWIVYDEASGTATISGLAGFVAACKPPTKDVGAFDALDRTATENQLFSTGDQDSLHFDAMIAELLADNKNAYSALNGWDDSYPSAYKEDRAKADSLGHDSDYRQNAYNPLYYLCETAGGAGTSQPAPHWRIRTGIEQGDTASVTEINLALALDAHKKVEDVDFATVWGQGHTMAERTGTATGNFIAWVTGLCGAEGDAKGA